MWGDRIPTRLDIPRLMEIVFNGGNYPVMYRDLDAAVRAWQDRGDKLPLLRLAAEVDTDWGVPSASSFSAGLYASVVCAEYPLLYPLSQSPAQRRTTYAAALAQARASRPNLFAPFSFDEGIASGLYITPLDQCLDCDHDVAALCLGIGRLAALEQRVATECDDHAHLTRSSRR